MPVRQAIGAALREQEARAFGFSPQRPTLLILGGSQGARAINQAVAATAALISPAERHTWQFLHVTGPADERDVRSAYAAAGVTAWVAPFLVEMESAYSLADLVIARSGASTIAELARCGKPAVLIPYPYAGAHQRANARHVEALGGGLVLEESQVSPERLLGAVRRLMADERLRAMMGRQMQGLAATDAADRLAQLIRDLAGAAGRPPRGQHADA
jgi:UDP-N-acetylglucosamine--N-acetylmuramyl-(pentapeptide) pyrophosphoryl-undecaprenol N-acetylglucosamine transferase